MNIADSTSVSSLDHGAALRSLRERAERRRLVSQSLPPTASPEAQRLVQELQVHQIELEMQYEELLLLQAEVEHSRTQFADLYEFAPIGYCTLAANGTLLQLNLRTSQLLGQERQQLLGRRLALFVAPAERHQFADFLGRLWAAPGRRQSCELAMRGPQDELFYAQLEGVASPESDDSEPTSCRLVLLDVTDRRRATDQLEASEARFRATFEQARDGMLLLDNQNFTDLNPVGLRLLGLSDKSQVLGRPLASFWPEFQPDGRRSLDVLTHCLHTAQTQGWCRLEWMRYSPAGEEIWDEMSFNPVLVDGRPLLHASWRDVTADRLNMQQLHESESRLQLALAAANTGVWAWDLDTDLLYQDARAQEILGLAPLAGTDRPLLPFALLQQALHPADAPRVAEALTLARGEHSDVDLEHRLLRPDGTVRYVAALGRFSYDEHTGQPLRFVGLVRDITARRQTEEALGYKNRLLDIILHNLPVLLARIGPDGRCREHVGQALGRLGLTPNELVGRLASEVFPQSAAYFDRLLAGERHSYVATPLHNGQPVYLQCFGFFDEAQQEVVIFALDITEPEQLKEEATRLRLRQQQEVLSAILSTQEEERRRIAEGLHNGVGQLLYGTRLHLDTLPPTEAVRASRQLLNEAIQATRSISFELTPSILEDFGLEVALRELVDRIPSRLAVDLNLHGLAEPLPGLLTTAIYRIVQELLSNVMKHAQAQEVFVQIAREDDQLYLSVEDDGVGFDAQAEATRGGIGLAGIRTRVGLLGGTVSINSRPGRGTGFFLHVPVPATEQLR